jgi:hypothetical protein
LNGRPEGAARGSGFAEWVETPCAKSSLLLAENAAPNPSFANLRRVKVINEYSWDTRASQDRRPCSWFLPASAELFQNIRSLSVGRIQPVSMLKHRKSGVVIP